MIFFGGVVIWRLVLLCRLQYGKEEPRVFQLIKFASNICWRGPLTLFDLFIA